MELEARLIEIVEKTPGRGGKVRMPLAVATYGIEVGRTAGGGDGTIDLGVAEFEQVVANFAKVGAPVPVYFGHLPRSDRRETPAAGFVEKVWIDGEFLMGLVDLGPRAWDAVVEERGFRSFSVELDRDIKRPNQELSGWSLTGGAITNVPALDVQYVAASQDASTSGERVQVNTVLKAQAEDKEDDMAEKATLEQAQAEVARLEAEVSNRDEKITKLEADVRAAAERADKIAEKFTAVQAELDEARAAKAQTELDAFVKEAIDKGAPAVLFEGYDEAEDKGAWLEGEYGSLDLLKKFVSKVPKAKMSAVSSGKSESEEDKKADAAARFSAAVREIVAKEDCSPREAQDRVRRTQPELYAEFTAHELDRLDRARPKE